eukprot:scaffold424_cov165-Ochromonas_danica.AAC.12
MKRKESNKQSYRPNKKTNNRPSWVKNQREERHPGSYPIEELKASEAYTQHIDQVNGVKRKYAVCVSYLGTKYQGLQINPGAKTIEAELERAFFLAGGIVESNYGYMQKVQWTRAARTDRGVHAITQCCAMKLLMPMDGRDLFIQQVNNFLPEEIRLQAMTKVTKGFNAKQQCTRREYHYLLPSFVLMPVAEAHAILSEAFARQGPIVGAGYEGGYVDPKSAKTLNRDHIESVRSSFINYRVPAEQLTLLREALELYKGTHLYHNFTTGMDGTESNAKRYITDFVCSDPYVESSNGIEWLRLSVLGQSFLFNQIRKMVAFAIDIARGLTTKDALSSALERKKMDIPLAPAMGLYLNDIFFDGYNSKQKRENDRDQRAAAKRDVQVGDEEPPAIEQSVEKGPEAEANDNAKEDVQVGDEEPSVVEKSIEQSVENGQEAEAKDKGTKEAEEEGDGEDDAIKREQIDWYSEEDVKVRLDTFRETVLHPHIYREEASSFGFLYYLDYCRAFPHPYKVLAEIPEPQKSHKTRDAPNDSNDENDLDG